MNKEFLEEIKNAIWDIPWVSSKPMMELKINETTEMITGLKL